MKKIILLIAFIVTPILIGAQSFFDALEDMDGVDFVVVNKDMFELLSKFNPEKLKDNEAMKVFEMIHKLKSLKVFSTENSAISETMERMVNTGIQKQNLIELMRIKEKDSRVIIYVKPSENKDYVNEVIMFIKGINKKTKGLSEAVIVSLTGKIDINKMSNLADTFIKNKK